jgi:hypothetical protein
VARFIADKGEDCGLSLPKATAQVYPGTVPDDVGGRQFQDGWEPDDDRGRADEEFASVVFDEDFVRSAVFHEPTAVERLLEAAQARAEAEAANAPRGRRTPDEEHELWDELYGRRHPDEAHGGSGYDRDTPSPYGTHGGALRPYRGSARWHRPVAWVLALVMGIGMVALAFSAVYRGAGGGGREDQVPQPASTGIDAQRSDEPGGGRSPGPPGTSKRSVPAVSAVPRTR